ncbi:hypothetical protein K280104A7_31450 [Candidatus Bariatricus faecipullorum]
MKSNLKKRILAAVLCMVMVFSGSSFAMAGDADTTAENGTEVSQDTGTTTTSSGEESQEQTTSGETGETTEGTQETGEQTETTTPETTTPDTTAPETTTPDTTAPETTTGNQETESAPATEEPVQSPAYDGKYEDDTVTISVTAEAGIVPEGAELSVTPIEKTEITDDMSEEDKAKAEEINAQYDLTEKKLNEDSEENEETMEGFLAYDISFLVNGEEVEPSGDVKVVMDFKEAAIPEGVSEDAAVAVKHLKEDETAEDGVVVEDMAEKADVQTTDKAEVEKVELTAESFSIYTIKWSNNNNRTLSVQVVNTNGDSIGNEKEVPLDENGPYTVKRIAEEFGLSGYNFVGAYLNSYSEETRGTKIQRLRWSSSQNQYNTESRGNIHGWTDVGDSPIYFVFESNLPGTVATADTSGFIKLSLFDYVVGSANATPSYNEYNQAANSWSGDSTGINKDKMLKFQSNSNGRDRDSINLSGSPNLQIVQDKLVDGFPVLNPARDEGSNQSLDYLFDSKGIDGIKSVHTGLNHLFEYNSDTRQYSYDSDKYYAYLDAKSDATNFVVYNQPATMHSGSEEDDNYRETHGFFPFSKYEAVDGSERGYKNGVTLDCNDRQNHYFGMSMSTQFMQPKNGMITQDEEMIFSFSGDDDVWVFIDGVLVMDIGGSHGAISGTIDFTTGKVVVADQSQGYIGEKLLANGVNASKLNITKDSDGNTISTLKDYEEFDLDFFYLERGNWDSNCKLEFNLAMINKNSVSVGKEITDVDTSKYGDVEFEYLIEVGEKETSLQPYKNQKYKIYNLDDRSYTGETGTTDSNGYFWLKHNQLAVFEEDKAAGSSGIGENLYYQVTELDVNSQEYNEIYINRTDIFSVGVKEEVSQDGTIMGNDTNQVYSAPSPVYQVSETGQVIFYNRCSEYNKRELHIKKEMSSGQTEDTFNMTVTLGGELYNGEYFLIDENDGTTSHTAINGIISLEVGQEAVIDDIPAETTFKVKEEELNPAEYNTPTYTVTNGGESPVTKGEASGVTVLGADSQVVVTNSPYVYVPTPAEEEVPHSKQIDWLGDDGNNTDTKLRGDYYYRLYLDVTGIPTEEPDPADILLILDYSSSMNSNYGSGTRWEAVQESARTAVNTLLPPGSSNKVGIVWFDRDTTDYDNVDFTADKEKLLSSIENNKPDRGTNYQAAFITAQRMLADNKTDGRNQFVVFVTDGEPYQWVNSSGGIMDTDTDEAKEHAIEQAKKFNGLSGFYAVSVGGETGKEFLQRIVDNVNAGIKDTIEANDEAELESTFQQILGSITRQISNVTIKDDLSKYVEFVNESGQTLAEQDDSEPVLETSIALKVTKTDKSGNVETLTASRDYTYQITGDTISVNFGSEYFLDPGAKYTISFNVKLTDEAFTDYETNNEGYGDTKGDSGTDYRGNSTSSGKDGFYSNDEATFTYTVDENGEAREKTGNYDKPVVQVHDRADWEIYKTSSTDSKIKLAGAEFKLIPIQEIPDDLDNLLSNPGNIYYKGVSQQEKEEPANVSELGYIQWSKVENGTESAIDNETAIPAGRYILAETKAPTGYSLSEVKWLVEVKYMEEPEIRPILTGGSYGNAIDAEETTTNNKKLYVLEIDNTPLYELPSAGGPGIYWYTIGGMLLMIAGTLILYKNKRREVLKR